MHQTPALRSLECDARSLDQLDDRQLTDIGLERQSGIITDASGRFVRRLAAGVGLERALRDLFWGMIGGLARRNA